MQQPELGSASHWLAHLTSDVTPSFIVIISKTIYLEVRVLRHAGRIYP